MIYAIMSIILIVSSLLLVTFNVLKSKWYAWLIYFSGLFTAYSTTMIGLSVVGSDISRELLMSNLALENGWDLSFIDPSNTSVLVGWFIPLLSQITTIETVWIYKVFLPIIFAVTPVILYFIFRKMIGDLKAFYASMFFIIMPVFALEISAIAKSMVAEAFMVLCFWVYFNAEWKWLYKVLSMLVLIIMALWIHYTVGILLCIYLGGVWAFSIIKSIKQKKIEIMQLGMIPMFVIVGVSFMAYFSYVAQGLIWNSVTGIFHYDFSNSIAMVQKAINPSAAMPTNAESTIEAYSMVKSAFGLDMFQLGWSGMGFRIIQILTQMLVVLGFGWVVWKRKLYNIPIEFMAGCLVAFGLLGLCVIAPTFSALINVTREYHIALMFLAPCLIVAFDGISYGVKWMMKD